MLENKVINNAEMRNHISLLLPIEDKFYQLSGDGS